MWSRRFQWEREAQLKTGNQTHTFSSANPFHKFMNSNFVIYGQMWPMALFSTQWRFYWRSHRSIGPSWNLIVSRKCPSLVAHQSFCLRVIRWMQLQAQTLVVLMMWIGMSDITKAYRKRRLNVKKLFIKSCIFSYAVWVCEYFVYVH